MRVRVAAIVIAATVSLVPGMAAADHCNGAVTQVDTPAGTFYVDDRGVMDEAIWIYMESNGLTGLQSGGVSPTGLYDDDCSHVPPDFLIF